MPPSRDAVSHDAQRAPECVGGVWDRTGARPTWAELGVATGWHHLTRPAGPRERIIRSLTRADALSYSSEPRR